MQNLIVALAVVGAAVFIGRRLWRIWRDPKNSSCGCGCSGCSSEPHCSPPRKTLPRHQP